MTRRELAFLACRLLAIFLLVLAVASLAEHAQDLWGLLVVREWLGLLVQAFGPAWLLLCSLSLWFAASRVVDALLPVGNLRAQRMGAEVGRAMLFAAGGIVLAMGVDEAVLLGQLGWQAIAQGSVDWLPWVAPAFALTLKVSIAIALMLGAGLQALLAKAERENIHQSARKDLEDASLIDLVGELATAAGSLGVRTMTDLAQKVVRSSLEGMVAAVDQRRPDFASVTAEDGRVTILFSDMEGFTEMTQRLGDERAHEVIKVHNKVVREAVHHQKGEEVELQGDGFLLAFPDSVRAIRCAIQIQQKLARHSEEHPHAPIRVRIGAHSGTPIREKDRFFGITLIMAARIAGQAVGGEILVSDEVYRELRDAGGFRFDEPAEAVLKGIRGRQRMVPVIWSDRTT